MIWGLYCGQGRRPGAGRGRTPARNFFSSLSLHNINIFSLNYKTTNILTLFNSFFWFRPWLWWLETGFFWYGKWLFGWCFSSWSFSGLGGAVLGVLVGVFMVVWRWFCGLFLCWFRGYYRSVVRLFCGGLRAVVWWLSRVKDGAAENGGGSRSWKSCREEEKELKCWKKWERPCVRELRGAALFFPLFPRVSQKHILLPFLICPAFLPFKIEWIGWLVNFLHNYCVSSPPLFFVFSLLLCFFFSFSCFFNINLSVPS